MKKLFNWFLLMTCGLGMSVIIIDNISDKYGTTLPWVIIGGCTVLFGAVLFWISMRDN